MWIMLPCLHLIVHELSPAFSEPSFITHCEFMLGWVMCPGHPHGVSRGTILSCRGGTLPRRTSSVRSLLQLFRTLRLARQ